MSVYKVRCHPGRINVDAAGLPPLRLEGLAIEAYFALESKAAPADPGAIEMTMASTRQVDPTDVGGGVASPDLHWRLKQLTGNSQNAYPRGVSDVGLIFTDYWRPRADIFGIMFDTGFDADQTAYNDVPREGCAVFLDPIRRIHGNDTPAFRRQVCYTALHELGHVFNLTHIYQGPGSFMRQRSTPQEVFEQCRYSDEQRRTLAEASADWDLAKNVIPGGTEFRDRGDIVGDVATLRRKRNSAKSSIVLTIQVAQSEFYRFEPVELDVRLRPTAKRATTVPDEIDPGYGRFIVWITAPDGSRRRYRPPNHYCGTGSHLPELMAGKSFERDISIFGEAGGYTFHQAGEHCLQAELTLPNGVVISSNVERVRIRSAQENRREYAAFREHLCQRAVARLLYYRAGRVTPSLFERGLAFAEAYPKSAAAAGVRYALGRALIKSAVSPTSRQSRKRQYSGNEQLCRALDCNAFQGHRRKNAEQALDKD